MARRTARKTASSKAASETAAAAAAAEAKNTEGAAAPTAAAQPEEEKAGEGNAASAPAASPPSPSPLNLLQLGSHPLAGALHALGVELEKLPPGPRQADLVVRLGELREDAQDLINGAPPKARRTPDAPPKEERQGGGGHIGAVPAGGARVRVTGPKLGRYRIGRKFGPEPVTLAVNAGELAQLEADPKLQVERIGKD